MANEFKVRKGLIVNGSGSTILDIQGSQGQLFSVTDQLSGSLFSVNDISGIPIMEVFSDNTLKFGQYLNESIVISGSFARVTGSLFGTASWAQNAVTASYVLQAVSSSFAITASFVTTAQTASFVTTAQTASFITASNVFGPYGSSSVLSSSFAATASFVTSASFAITSSFATSAFQATSASFATSASQATSASFATSASYASNGGVTQLLAGANITLSPTNGLGQVTISSTGGGGSSFNTATGSYGSFYSTQTQTNVAGTARSMSLNVTDITNGVSVSGSTDPYNTYIKTENAGVYDIQFSAQVDKTDSGTDEIWIWLRKNGTNLTDTATSIQLVGNGAHYVAAWNFFANAAANDYFQLMWYSPDANVRLHAEPAFGVVPGIPSLIVTANRVDQFLSNTGSFSGTFTGSITGSLFGTASWAQNAITSSYALTASFLIGHTPYQITIGSVTASVDTNPNSIFLIKSGSVNFLNISSSGNTTLSSDLFIVKNLTTDQPVLTVSQSVVKIATQSFDPTGMTDAGSIWFTSTAMYVGLN